MGNDQLSFGWEGLPSLLISIRPEWYHLILSGRKKYEYRRKFIREPATVYLYVTAPTSAICAVARFGRPIVGSVEEIAEVGRSERPGIEDGIRRYLTGLDEGFAIPIEQYAEIGPITIAEIKARFPNFVVPQSYVRLDQRPKLLEFLRGMRVSS